MGKEDKKMTYDQFCEFARASRPEIQTITPHAGVAGSRNKRQSVGIAFRAGGRLYDYRGTYAEILNRLSVPYRWCVTSRGECYNFYEEAEARTLLAEMHSYGNSEATITRL